MAQVKYLIDAGTFELPRTQADGKDAVTFFTQMKSRYQNKHSDLDRQLDEAWEWAGTVDKHALKLCGKCKSIEIEKQSNRHDLKKMKELYSTEQTCGQCWMQKLAKMVAGDIRGTIMAYRGQFEKLKTNMQCISEEEIRELGYHGIHLGAAFERMTSLHFTPAVRIGKASSKNRKNLNPTREEQLGEAKTFQKRLSALRNTRPNIKLGVLVKQVADEHHVSEKTVRRRLDMLDRK